jgi:predicted ester cyclase
MKVLISALVAALLILSLTASSSGRIPLVSDQNKEVVRAATDAMNARQYSALSYYFAPDMIDHNPYSGQAPGLPGFVQGLRMWYSAFPDWASTNDDLIAEGDQVVTHWTGQGTRTDLLTGLTSNGAKVKLIGIRGYRLTDGMIVETGVTSGPFHQTGELRTAALDGK